MKNNKKMRSVSFVEHLQLEFDGNLFNEALLLEDVDNDGKNELVIGSVEGELMVFKGSYHPKPWKKYQHDGMITCIAAGDMWNTGKNVLVSITADGWYHVFDLNDQPEDTAFLKLTFSQVLHSNAKTAIIADIDGDGVCELVTGHTDRVVFVYKWQKFEEKNLVIEKTSQQAENRFPHEGPSDIKQKTSGGRSRKESKVEEMKKFSPDSKQLRKSSVLSTEGNNLEEENKMEKITGQFVISKTWTLPSQITSLALYRCIDKQHLLVSQSGGNFVTLFTSEIKTEGTDVSKAENSEMSFFNFPLPFASGNQDSGIPTAMTVISNKHTRHSPNIQSSLLALGMLDGNISLLDQEQILWTLPLEKNLLTLSKLDITSDGYEEIITCAWDGSTYIIDSEKNIVYFKFKEDVKAFSTGYFGMESGENVPCFVFVTFSNTVVIYWNIRLSQMTHANLLTVMESKEEYKRTLKDLGLLDDDTVDEIKFQEMCSRCLYGGTT